MKNILTTCNRGGLCSFIVAILENSNNGNYEIITNGYADVKQILKEVYYSIDNGEQLYFSIVKTDENGNYFCEKLENVSVDLSEGLKLKSNSLVVSVDGENIEIEENQGGGEGSDIDTRRLLPSMEDCLYPGDVLTMYLPNCFNIDPDTEYTLFSSLDLDYIKQILGPKFRDSITYGNIYLGKKLFQFNAQFHEGNLDYLEIIYYPDYDEILQYYWEEETNSWHEWDGEYDRECESAPVVILSEEECRNSKCEDCFTNPSQVGIFFEEAELNPEPSDEYCVPTWLPEQSTDSNNIEFTILYYEWEDKIYEFICGTEEQFNTWARRFYSGEQEFGLGYVPRISVYYANSGSISSGGDLVILKQEGSAGAYYYSTADGSIELEFDDTGILSIQLKTN